MKKIDFTKEGTKLPQIPSNTKFSTILEANHKQPFSLTVSVIDDLVSYGVIEIDNVVCIKADKLSYVGKNYLVFRLSDLEVFAKEQGMSGEERKLIGYKLKSECNKYQKACVRILYDCDDVPFKLDSRYDFLVDTPIYDSLKEAGVLHWFNEVFEEPPVIKGNCYETVDPQIVIRIADIIDDVYYIVRTYCLEEVIIFDKLKLEDIQKFLHKPISIEEYKGRTKKLHREWDIV